MIPNLTRRRLLRAGTALGVGGLLSSSVAADEGHMDMPSYSEHSSPDMERYVKPLPIPEERTPDGRRRGAEYHNISAEETTHEFHPDLGETTVWGYDGQFPGPIISARKGQRLAIEFDSSTLPTEHLFNVDERIAGTTSENYVGYDGPVPEVRRVTHFHGLKIDPSNDGQAEMWDSPEGHTGPRFSDPVQELPNRQDRLTSMYHDHARGISRLNNYAGLVGPYQITSRREKWMNLPSGDYDVPLVLADRSFTDDGELFYPGMFMANVAGDTPTVNGAAWPYMEVEPRKYRFRIINVSNARTYDLGLAQGSGGHDDGGHHGSVPKLHQISAGHGFLEDVASIGPHGDMDSLTLSPFERAEVIVDFSDYAGQTLTVTNDAMFPYNGGGHGDGGHGGMDMDHPQFHEVMQFHVAGSANSTDTSVDPSDLWLPEREGVDASRATETRQVTMQMKMNMDDPNEPMLHTLNNKRWGDPIQIKPQLGSTEIWELKNDDDHTHPIHLHLVEFDVIEREMHNTDQEPQPPLPNERGGKDVVRVNPGETVRIAVKFDGFTGKFPFHCHILEHEEHDMMRMFEVVRGRDHERGRDRRRNHDDRWGDDHDSKDGHRDGRRH